METVRHEQDAIEWWSSWDEPDPATAEEEVEFDRTRERLRRMWARVPTGPSPVAPVRHKAPSPPCVRRPARRRARVRRAAARRRLAGRSGSDPGEPHPACAARRGVAS